MNRIINQSFYADANLSENDSMDSIYELAKVWAKDNFGEIITIQTVHSNCRGLTKYVVQAECHR